MEHAYKVTQASIEVAPSIYKQLAFAPLLTWLVKIYTTANLLPPREHPMRRQPWGGGSQRMTLRPSRRWRRRRRRQRSRAYACVSLLKWLAPYTESACHAPLGELMSTSMLVGALATIGFPCRRSHGRDGSGGGRSPDAGPFCRQTSSPTRHSTLNRRCGTRLATLNGIRGA
jgi:hypothetical protein